MQLEALTLQLRPRNSMESFDLGVRLWQQHVWPLWRVWMLLALPLALLIPWIFNGGTWAVLGSLLLFWWLKPWLSRSSLLLLGHAVFGQSLQGWDLVQQWFAPSSRRGLWASLLWRRASSLRGVQAAVWLLEAQQGPAARRRMAVLVRRMRGQFLLLATAMLLLEATLVLAVFVLLMLMVQDNEGHHFREALWQALTESHGRWSFYAVYVAITGLTEPLFVACSFCLYLNRRTMLEAWDIELVLRRLQRKLAAGSTALLLCLGLALVGSVCSPPAGAQPAPVAGVPLADSSTADSTKVEAVSAVPILPPPAQLQRAKAQVQALPEFNRSEEQGEWQLKPMFQKQEWAQWLQKVQDWWKHLFDTKPKPKKKPQLGGEWVRYVAIVAKALLLLVLAVALIWIGLKVARLWPGRNKTKAGAYVAPEAIMGLDVRPESLPDDVAAAFAHLYAHQGARAALALLIRACLSDLINRWQIPLQAGDTESDCLRRTVTMAARPRQFLEDLFALWCQVAYAGVQPEAALLLALGPRFAADWRDATHLAQGTTEAVALGARP